MSAETRPLTDPERRYLGWWLKNRTLAGPSLIDNILLSCFGAGCMTLLAYVPLALAWKAFATKRLKDSGVVGLIAFALPFLLWIGVLIYVFAKRRKPPPDADDPREQIREDLAGGVARIHRFRATAVILATRDARRERNYFVRLDDNRVLFLGSWQPPTCRLDDMTFLPDEKGFPSSEFEIAASPNYLLILDVVGGGDFLRPADEFELQRHPELSKGPCRLESGRFIPVAWEDLRKTYG